jgi:hypothetical protein
LAVRQVVALGLTVLGADVAAHLGEVRGAVDELDLADPFGLLGVVEDPDVGGNAGVVEHVGWQRHDGVDQIVAPAASAGSATDRTRRRHTARSPPHDVP